MEEIHRPDLGCLDTEQKRHMSLKTPPCSFWIPALVSSSNALGHEAGFLNDHVE